MEFLVDLGDMLKFEFVKEEGVFFWEEEIICYYFKEGVNKIIMVIFSINDEEGVDNDGGSDDEVSDNDDGDDNEYDNISDYSYSDNYDVLNNLEVVIDIKLGYDVD